MYLCIGFNKESDGLGRFQAQKNKEIMTTQEFKNIAIGNKVRFAFANLFSGKEEIHIGVITHILGECICIADETQPGEVYLNYRDVFCC